MAVCSTTWRTNASWEPASREKSWARPRRFFRPRPGGSLFRRRFSGHRVRKAVINRNPSSASGRCSGVALHDQGPFAQQREKVVGLVCHQPRYHRAKGSGRTVEESQRELTRRGEVLLKVLSDLQRSNEELKATQSQLIQAAKLESIGTLAAGVAHEVKNPLQTILMGVDYMTEHPSAGPETMTLVLSEIREAIIRADSIVRDLLEFSAANHPTVTEEDPISCREIADVNELSIHPGAHPPGERAGPDLPIPLDKTKIEQVFINLPQRHSPCSTGTLTIRTRRVRFTGRNRPAAQPPLTSKSVTARSSLKSRIPVHLEKHLPKIFDPFFTTKPTGKGTGLGLPVTKKIIELLSGAIDVSNLPGRGGVRATILFRSPTPTSDEKEADSGR